MFNRDKEILKTIDNCLYNYTETLKNYINSFMVHIKKEQDEKIDNLNKRLDYLKLEIEKKLTEFRSEMINKYFDTLEKIFKAQKEISLIESLAHQFDNKDFARLKSLLLQPILEERWKEKEKQEAQKIEQNIQTLGEKLLQERKRLYEEYLTKEREGKDVSLIKAKLEILDMIIKKE